MKSNDWPCMSYTGGYCKCNHNSNFSSCWVPFTGLKLAISVSFSGCISQVHPWIQCCLSQNLICNANFQKPDRGKQKSNVKGFTIITPPYILRYCEHTLPGYFVWQTKISFFFTEIYENLQRSVRFILVFKCLCRVIT